MAQSRPARRRRRWWRWCAAGTAVALALAVFAAGAAVSARVARRVEASLRPPRQPVGAPTGLAGVEDLTLRSQDGVVLRGWYVPSQNRAAVILVHGHGGQRAQLLPEAVALARHGYGVLLFDWRGHGESGGARTTWGVEEQRDLEAAIDYVSARPDVDPRRVGVVGFSMGAMVAAEVAARDRRVHAAVLEGAYTSLEEMWRHDERRWGWLSGNAAIRALRRAGISPEMVQPLDAMQRIAPRPVLLISGASDGEVPSEVTIRLAAAAPQAARLWIIPRATHTTYAATARGELGRRLTEFFDTALLGRTPVATADALARAR